LRWGIPKLNGGLLKRFFATEEGQIAINRPTWEARSEHLRLVFGRGGKLSRLEELAKEYRDNGDVQRYLGLALEQYEEYEKAGRCFTISAKQADGKKKELARHGDAAIAFLRAGLTGGGRGIN
jgi:hypothetical protein